MSVNVLVRDDLRVRQFSYDMAVLAGLVEAARQELPTRVLVVGCGDGREAAQLALSFDADVIGIDARSRFDRAASAYASLRTGDPTALGFADGAFDFIYSHQNCANVAALRASLYQMSRVLSRGGGFCLRFPARHGLNSAELRGELIAAFGAAADVTQAFYEDRYADSAGPVKAFSRTRFAAAFWSSRYFIGCRINPKR